jgi:truncated hemoglobin YjbI
MTTATTTTTAPRSSSTTKLGAWNSGHRERKETLLNKIGGEQTLQKAVDIFYDRLLQDMLLRPFFQRTNMTILKWHQLNLLTVAFGPPTDFDVASLILTRHQALFDAGLAVQHLDLFVGHFVETFRQLELEPDHIYAAVQVLEELRPVFVQGHRQAMERHRQRRLARRVRGAAVVLAVTVAWILWRRNEKS